MRRSNAESLHSRAPVAVVAQQGNPPSLTAIGYLPADQQVIVRNLQGPAGLTIVAGPQRSQGSPSVRAMLPQIRRSTDLILLDCLADGTAARRAVQAARGGSHVLAGMQLTRACRAFDCFEEWGLPPCRLIDALVLLICQCRVPRLCSACSLPDDDNDELRRVLAGPRNLWMADRPVAPRKAAPDGCSDCLHTGYRGTSLVYELVEIDARARSLLASDLDPVQLEAALLGEGRTIWDHGLRLIADGAISLKALQGAVRQPR